MSWASLILKAVRAGRMRTIGRRCWVRLWGWIIMCKGKGHLHKKWGDRIMKVHYCSSYMLFNFKFRVNSLPEAPIFGHQYRWSVNDPTCVRLRQWWFKCPKRIFRHRWPQIQVGALGAHCCTGVDLGLFNDPSTSSPSVVRSSCQWWNTLEVAPSCKLLSLSHYFFFFFFFFFLNLRLLSFEAGPHVGLYIQLYYASWPLMPGFASTSLAVLSFCVGLTLGDHSPCRTSTEMLFSDAP